jgi:hypothetical protein
MAESELEFCMERMRTLQVFQNAEELVVFENAVRELVIHPMTNNTEAVTRALREIREYIDYMDDMGMADWAPVDRRDMAFYVSVILLRSATGVATLRKQILPNEDGNLRRKWINDVVHNILTFFDAEQAKALLPYLVLRASDEEVEKYRTVLKDYGQALAEFEASGSTTPEFGPTMLLSAFHSSVEFESLTNPPRSHSAHRMLQLQRIQARCQSISGPKTLQERFRGKSLRFGRDISEHVVRFTHDASPILARVTEMNQLRTTAEVLAIPDHLDLHEDFQNLFEGLLDFPERAYTLSVLAGLTDNEPLLTFMTEAAGLATEIVREIANVSDIPRGRAITNDVSLCMYRAQNLRPGNVRTAEISPAEMPHMRWSMRIVARSLHTYLTALRDPTVPVPENNLCGAVFRTGELDLDDEVPLNEFPEEASLLESPEEPNF